MASVAPEDDTVVVKTTLPTVPMPLNAERVTVTTERLLLRALQPDDLDALHALRRQPEVMIRTPKGVVDETLEETRANLSRFLPPNDATTQNCAIYWKETGEFIGGGGCHKLEGSFGWPEVGYMFRSEYWGRGLATEFLRGYLELYDRLPRSEVEIKVKRTSVPEGRAEVDEQLVAIVEASHANSSKVLLKSGFEQFLEFVEPDLRDPSVDIRLRCYRYFPCRRRLA